MRPFILLFTLFMFSCATLIRDNKPMIKQTLTILDGATGQPISRVSVTVNTEKIGMTDKQGMITFPVPQSNKADKYLLLLEAAGYKTVKTEIPNTVGAGYVVGNVALFLLGLVPGVVGLAIDGTSGRWYTYKDKLVIEMYKN